MTNPITSAQCLKLMFPLQKAHEMCVVAYYGEADYYKKVAMEHLKELKALLNSMEEI